MNASNLKCFGCGGKGHIERDCPSAIVAGTSGDDRPMWCGRCDRRTRLMEVNNVASRCQECHPLAHQHLTQVTRCAGCRVLVYVWDVNLCGQHSSPVVPYSGPAQEEIASIVAGETRRRRHDDPDAA